MRTLITFSALAIINAFLFNYRRGSAGKAAEEKMAAETTGESTEEEVNWEEIEESNGYTKTGYKNIAGYHPTDPGQKMTSP